MAGNFGEDFSRGFQGSFDPQSLFALLMQRAQQQRAQNAFGDVMSKGFQNTPQGQKPTPETNPDFMGALAKLATMPEGQGLLNLYSQAKQSVEPHYTTYDKGLGGTLLQKQIGNQRPTFEQVQPPLFKGMNGDWQAETDTQGNPVTEPIPGTNATRVKEFKYQINPMTNQLEKVYRFSAGGTTPQPPNQTNRLDKSYEFHTSKIAAIAKPIQDRLDRIDRLKTSLEQNDPQADALVAPELLTVMAGGQGSGLRMNEAEISRIVGGRNNWESLKSKAMAWQTDPKQPFLITPEQRVQVKALVDAMDSKLQAKQDAIGKAQSDLVDAQDVQTHRRIYSNLQNKLLDVTPKNGIVPPIQKVQSSLGIQKITSDDDYNKLPSGTVFIAPDGSQRRKP